MATKSVSEKCSRRREEADSGHRDNPPIQEPSLPPRGLGVRQPSGAFRWTVHVRKRQRTAALQDAAARFLTVLQHFSCWISPHVGGYESAIFRPRSKFSCGVLLRTALYLILICATTTGVLAKDKPSKGKSKKEDKAAAEGTKLFDSAEVLRLRIDIPEKGIETLKKYQWYFGPQAEREQVRAIVHEGSRVYTNVALHLKGAAGSFRAS